MPHIHPERLADFIKPFRVEPGSHVRLPKDFDPALETRKATDKELKQVLRGGVEMLAEYQERLAAQGTHGVIVVLQAMDAAGKDGTIRHVMSGVNPQGVSVHSFKIPSAQELDHDYLWRYAKALPARGRIGIYNRSYYEEVLVVRVHPTILNNQKLPPETLGPRIWQRRFREINEWEHYLTDQGFRFVKLFLNVSREEQRRRFLDRIDREEKNWKFSANDARERSFWDDYQAAFGDLLTKTSTKWAPWYVIPADRKPFARIAAAAVIAKALMDIDPAFPTVSREAKSALVKAREGLLAEGPLAPRAEPDDGSKKHGRHGHHDGTGGRHGRKRGRSAKQAGSDDSNGALSADDALEVVSIT